MHECLGGGRCAGLPINGQECSGFARVLRSSATSWLEQEDPVIKGSCYSDFRLLNLILTPPAKIMKHLPFIGIERDTSNLPGQES